MKPIESWWVFPGFELEHIVTGLDKPVNIATVPRPGNNSDDPLLYFTELYGRVRAITNDYQIFDYAENLLNFTPDCIFPGSGESGVTGICVEPMTGDLFVSMIYQEESSIKSKVVRMKSSDGLRIESMETVLENIPSTRFAHQIQALTIGFDSKLYVNLGDGYSTPKAAQDDNDLRGKVLRVNLDGSIPKDNPNPESMVYAKGFRNPFGAAWRKSDKSLYISDNGLTSDDRIACVEAGEDYGWPKSMRQNSIFLWNFTQGLAALDFMQDGQFPSEFDDNLFLVLSGPSRYKAPLMKGKKIVKIELNQDGSGARSCDDFITYIGEGLGMPVGLSFGTDGLFFTDLWGNGEVCSQQPGGNIFKVRPLEEG